MEAHELEWEVATDRYNPKYLVKGTVLEYALVPPDSRFMISVVRTWDGEFTGTRFTVRDAATVTDEEVKAGKRSRTVAVADTLDDALEYCRANSD